MNSVHDPLFSLRDRVVVITGGLGQLGASMARTLVGRGARVAVFDAGAQDFAGSRLEDIADDETLRLFPVDVTNRESIEAALGTVCEVWETPHGMVNAAALDAPPDAPPEENGPFETYPAGSFERVLQVNVTGVMLCCQAVGAAMAKSGRGSIVNIGSTYGMVSPNQDIYEYRRMRGDTFYKPVAYSASKSAIYNLTRYLATYWAGKGVRVNTLTPGGVFNGQEKEFLDAYQRRVPMGRMARDDEMNGPVVFLLSDASSYMTGANLVVDGGWTAW